jgi:putative transposase
VARRWPYPRRQGRPPTQARLRRLIVRLAKENETGGYRRIPGRTQAARYRHRPEHRVSILRESGIDPAPRRAGSSWKEFLRAQAEGIIACDFISVDSVFLRRFYVLLVVEIATRRVHLAGVTSKPDASWVTQQARNFVARWDTVPFRFLIRDRDAKYASAFDEIFLTEGMRIVRTPIKAPRANAFAERFVGTLRRECLDRILILGRGHLESVLRPYLAHYDKHRPHRALDMNPPAGRHLSADHDDFPSRVSRRDILGGVIHEYKRAA